VARVAARRAVVAGGGARDAARDGGCGSVSSRHLIAWRQPRSAMPLARPRRVSVLNAQSVLAALKPAGAERESLRNGGSSMADRRIWKCLQQTNWLRT